MRYLKLLLVLLFLSPDIHAQAWSGILSAVGSGSCSTLAPSNLPSPCAIDWTQAGIPGGIPSALWTQLGSTITSTGSDQTSQIQTALNGCGGSGHNTSTTGQFVLLASGTFQIASLLVVPSYCELRGGGANLTILNCTGTSGTSCVNEGSSSQNIPGGTPLTGQTNITAGATAGSTSITLASVSGVSTGTYLVVSESNNTAWVNNTGSEGQCTFCDGGWSTTGAFLRGQIVEVEGVAGNVVTISPGLYTAYNQSPFAVPFTAMAKYAGVKGIQIFYNNTGYTDGVFMDRCAYCWVEGIETNYTDGNMFEDSWGYRDQIQSNYFSNAFKHGAGVDSDVFIDYKTSATLVINNIIERGHNSIMLNWGAAGNVIAYNYTMGAYDAGGSNASFDGIVMHGPHPQFNLIEGNVTPRWNPDNIWGSSSHNTAFRNWMEGTTVICDPLATSRATVTCASPTSPFQIAYSNAINALSWYDNNIGNIDGSVLQNNLKPYGTGTITIIPLRVWPTATLFDFDATNLMYGYDAHDDNGGSGDTGQGQNTTPYLTSTIYNDYTFGDTSLKCQSGGSSSTCSATLPASFFLSSKPVWWQSGVAYPAIGPDVTGGTGPGGHTSLTASNPAQYCYMVTMSGTEGGKNSPLTFNENTCYPSTSPPAPAAVMFAAVPLPTQSPAPMLTKSSPSQSYVSAQGFSQDGINWIKSLVLTFTGTGFTSSTVCAFSGTAVPCTCGSSTTCTVTVPQSLVPVPTSIIQYPLAVSNPPAPVPVLQ